MLIIAGRLHVDPDARDRYLVDCADVVAQARNAPGCLDFALTADLLDPGRINVYERWESDEQLHAFRGTGPDAGQTEQIRDAEVLKYRVAATERPERRPINGRAERGRQLEQVNRSHRSGERWR